jgi:hypothetical protein
VSDAYDHSKHVDKWMRDLAKSLPPEQLMQLFERTMGALWSRTYRTLGGVTLGAVTDRVLDSASERFAPFGSITVGTEGIDFQALRELSGVFDDRGALAEGIRFVIVEFISVIGNLTGDLLTPALYVELSKITRKDLAPNGKHEGETS